MNRIQRALVKIAPRTKEGSSDSAGELADGNCGEIAAELAEENCQRLDGAAPHKRRRSRAALADKN